MSRKSGIVNVTMVITEEKILSNIDKIQKMINPNSKKKIVQLDEDTFFKDLIESIKTYLIEYPNKKNFPINVYRAIYALIETSTTLFEDTTKKIEKLIKQREQNIALSVKLKNVVDAVDGKTEGWKEKISSISSEFQPDIVKAVKFIVSCKNKESKEYIDAMKLLNARINNLETNLHIEIDMERLEDTSKALSYIGVEIADALKLIPTPEEKIEEVVVESVAKVGSTVQNVNTVKSSKKNEDIGIEELLEKQTIEEAKKAYEEQTTFVTKPSFWKKVKNSKIVRAATYVFKIRIRIELPSNALPEGRGEN